MTVKGEEEEAKSRRRGEVCVDTYFREIRIFCQSMVQQFLCL